MKTSKQKRQVFIKEVKKAEKREKVPPFVEVIH